jgi:hypothetical protein
VRAAGCQISSLEATEQALSDVLPGNPLDGAGLQFPDPAADLSIPGFFDAGTVWLMKTLDQGAGDRGPILLVQSENLRCSSFSAVGLMS